MKIGVMFGNPETTTGGKALKFYASIRLEVRKIETIAKGSEDATGNLVRVKVLKNKVAPPYRKVEMEIEFGKGISASGSLLDAALKYELIQKSGSWYSYGEERIGQGRENAKSFIETNTDVAVNLEAKLRQIIFPSIVPPVETEISGEAEPVPTKKKAPAEAGSEDAPKELF